MEITLLGQGLESNSKNSVGHQLIKSFADKDFHSFFGMSAFASQAGIRGLALHINTAKKQIKNITIVVGIDQKGTSMEALEELLSLKIHSFIFYQPAISIFHPKIYLFEGENKSELIIGSSNPTSQGLFTNVETSLLISIDQSIASERKILEQLKDYFKSIFDLSDPNLQRISRSLISKLVKANIVPTEQERKASQDKSTQGQREEISEIISKFFPRRETAKIPSEFRGTRKKALTPEATKSSKTVPSVQGKLVWTRKKLPASSVQIGSSGTNPTGGLRLVQADFIINGRKIDQTSYFRNTLFGKFVWKQIRSDPYVESVIVPFEITIKGVFFGIFNLEIRHKPSGEAGQHNYTTSISWGELSEAIRKSNLTGSRLDMYAPNQKGNPFQIIIS